MATLTGAVLAGLIISDQVIALSTREPFTVAKKSAEFVKLSTAYFCLSIATSLTTTLLITLRILLVQRAARGLNNPRRFNPIIEIIVESASLYSVTLLVFVVLDITKNPNVFFVQNIHSQMAGIAPLLISLRVAAGLSRPRDEWSSAGPPSMALQFAQTDSTLGSDTHRGGSASNIGKLEVSNDV